MTAMKRIQVALRCEKGHIWWEEAFLEKIDGEMAIETWKVNKAHCTCPDCLIEDDALIPFQAYAFEAHELKWTIKHPDATEITLMRYMGPLTPIAPPEEA